VVGRQQGEEVPSVGGADLNLLEEVRLELLHHVHRRVRCARLPLLVDPVAAAGADHGLRGDGGDRLAVLALAGLVVQPEVLDEVPPVLDHPPHLRRGPPVNPSKWVWWR
jgi:hypothetical protein